jgi:hypothetical protein
MARNIRSTNAAIKNDKVALDPNELKAAVRDALGSMEIPERATFIAELEHEMRRLNLDIRAYLVPLGIPGRSPEDLTPTEVGHLVRYLKLNVPQAMPAVERAMSYHSAFGSDGNRGGDRLAA